MEDLDNKGATISIEEAENKESLEECAQLKKR
jgi:hypothetical protein